jgi:Peptidase family M23
MSEERARLTESIRAAASYRPDPDQVPVVLTLPFEGSWLAVNSPARRVPSHGTHFLGQTFAIDFVAVDARRRTADVRDWRTLLATEPATRFIAFGRTILSPIDGHVVAAHDGEPDHPARRAPLPLLGYLLTQGSRLRRGLAAVTGNHLILALAAGGPYVALVHLRKGSLLVRPGDPVAVGQPVAACGNSGNSTQPHVHVQVMDSTDLLAARGLPMAFRSYLAWPKGAKEPRHVTDGMPNQRERVEAMPVIQ